MDVSLNMIDLEYLTNPAFVKLRKKLLKTNNKEDITFYRKRIFQLTKDLLRGKYINAELDNAFSNYSRICIGYFKFSDQSDIIQHDYVDIVRNEKKTVQRELNQKAPNHLLMCTMQPVSKKITDCIPIKYIKKQQKPFMPTNRNINLKDPKFRSKGVLKKNISNTYGTQPKKKKISKI